MTGLRRRQGREERGRGEDSPEAARSPLGRPRPGPPLLQHPHWCTACVSCSQNGVGAVGPATRCAWNGGQEAGRDFRRLVAAVPLERLVLVQACGPVCSSEQSPHARLAGRSLKRTSCAHRNTPGGARRSLGWNVRFAGRELR